MVVGLKATLDGWGAELLNHTNLRVKIVRKKQELAGLAARWDAGTCVVVGYELLRAFVTADDSLATQVVLDTPDIVVLDEGHRISQPRAKVRRVVDSFRTKRRIALSGTPMPNRHDDLHSVVSWVRPGLLGTLAEFRQRFTRPAEAGGFRDSSAADVRVMKRRTHLLSRILQDCVHRVGPEVLRAELPPLTEFVISVRLSPLQRQLYRQFLSLDSTVRQGQFFAQYSALQPLLNHPVLLHAAVGAEGAGTPWWHGALEGRAVSLGDGGKLPLALALIRAALTKGEKVGLSGNGVLSAGAVLQPEPGRAAAGGPDRQGHDGGRQGAGLEPRLRRLHWLDRRRGPPGQTDAVQQPRQPAAAAARVHQGARSVPRVFYCVCVCAAAVGLRVWDR